jgi:hypothetical protein
MASEKLDVPDDLGSKGSKEQPPEEYPEQYVDVETGNTKPLKRALEGRHMQMIAIVSPSFTLKRRGRRRTALRGEKGNPDKNKPSNQRIIC